MSITVGKLIEQLSKLDLELQVYACHGASGSVDEVGSAYLAEVVQYDIDMGMDLKLGEPYISIYIGN